MKKIIFLIISLTLVFDFALLASNKVEIITNTSKSFNLNEKSSTISIEECKKYLGEENFKFINEVYNNTETALLKCKEELSK